MVSRPEASASPNSTAASAAPVSWPRYDIWTTAATSSAQSIVTGEAVLTTTTVRGLAAATCRTSATWSGGRSIVVASRPSVSRSSWPTTTTATSAAAGGLRRPLDGVGLRRRAGLDGEAGERDRAVGGRGVELGDHLVGGAGVERDLGLDRRGEAGRGARRRTRRPGCRRAARRRGRGGRCRRRTPRASTGPTRPGRTPRSGGPRSRRRARPGPVRRATPPSSRGRSRCGAAAPTGHRPGSSRAGPPARRRRRRRWPAGGRRGARTGERPARPRR